MKEDFPFDWRPVSERDEKLGNLSPGTYPWDLWHDQAIGRGVDANLAELGRAVMREAVNHNWDDALQTECGWQDDGQQMLDLAIARPSAARRRWTRLLQTDGERVPPPEGPRFDPR